MLMYLPVSTIVEVFANQLKNITVIININKAERKKKQKYVTLLRTFYKQYARPVAQNQHIHLTACFLVSCLQEIQFICNEKNKHKPL